MNRPIFLTPIWVQTTQKWHVLNLSNGSVGLGQFETYDTAWEGIPDGTERAGVTVRRISMEGIREAVAAGYDWALLPVK